MLALNDADDAARVADWVELELSLGEESFSKSKLNSVIREASSVEPAESFTSDVWRHLRRRIARYSADFFEIHSDVVLRCAGIVEGRLDYQVCLFFSLYGAPMQQGSDPKLFERMSAEAICNYVGGRVFVFGWPVLPDVQTAIADRVQQVSELMQERFVEAPAIRYKDRGVDIIAWKHFEEPDHTDYRSCQFVLLSQCAAGHNWPDKTRELPMGSWEQYIHWANVPMAGFAVPCVIDDDLWHDIAREVEGLVFDRIRLVNLLPKGVQDANLKGELGVWLNEQIEEHRA